MVIEEDYVFPELIWAQNSWISQDFLSTIFPSDKEIIEAMVVVEIPWEDFHHRSCFLPKLIRLDSGDFKSTIVGSVYGVVNPLAIHGFFVEGNMANISETIPTKISRNPKIVENVFIG